MKNDVKKSTKNNVANESSDKGFFGIYGGRFVPPELNSYLDELEKNYEEAKKDLAFQKELNSLLKNYVGRPSPVFLAKNISKITGCKVYLKREDLNHTGAHKINNTLGQALLAKRMKRTEIIAETGAGQHGVASATAAALLGLKCKVFMGKVDAEKQSVNVQRMKLLGAEVVVVEQGTKTLKDAVDAALGYLMQHKEVFYLLGSVVGPHPYPTIVRDFQKVIGEEARKQIAEEEGKLPDYLIACIGGGSNAMGLFTAFLKDKDVKMIGVEPAGKGLNTGLHAATLAFGTPGIIHGFKCRLLQDSKGQPEPVYSIASGLDYPGVGPEVSMLSDSGRIEKANVTDKEAIAAFKLLSENEGIIPALESSHALAYLLKNKARFRKEDVVVINLSGRGDKDLDTVLSL